MKIQCHPESTKKNIEAMIQHCPDDLMPGPFVQSVEKFLANDFESINSITVQIMNNLLFSKISIGETL